MVILVSNMREASTTGFARGPILSRAEAAGLERSCGIDRIVQAPPVRGIDRIEARFHGDGYSPHRHDTYALGLTLSGVQTFRYRGVSRYSLPGNILVLHPDELHDGAAGTDDGLLYRMLYLPPECLIAATGDDRRLPFVPDPILDDDEFRQCLAEALGDLDAEPTDLLLDDLLERLARMLWRHADARGPRLGAVARAAVLRCREHLHENCDRAVTSAELERIGGLDRFTLARHFRALLGTSPHRYLVMRRLQKGRSLMAGGAGLADTAFACGFADQSHFTRHFKNAFGLTPGRWLGLTAAATRMGESTS
jgi:AraC-like DNA-binding protein